MAISYLPISWKKYHENAQKLAAAIISRSIAVDEIVAISRGGLSLGHLLTDLLRTPISTIAIQSYTDIQTQGNLTITAGLQTSVKGKHILLVDDVSDTGKTLLRAKEYLSLFHPKEITTVTMFFKPQSIYRPDFYADETTKWILFPYEPIEMIIAISKQLSKEGKNKSEIQEFLEHLEYTDKQIAFARRHYLAVNKE